MAPATQGAGCSRTEEYVAYFAGSAGPPQSSAAGCRRVRMRKLFCGGPKADAGTGDPRECRARCGQHGAHLEQSLGSSYR